jgi:ligand-binding SRPBCC domain-containing protein
MYELHRELLIPAPIDELFTFFSDPANLARITPKSVGFRDLTPNKETMRTGLRIIHQIRVFGIPQRWETVIEEYDPPHGFVDRQAKGPYKYWRHRHSFEEVPGGTLMRDDVQYELPFGPLGSLTHRLFVKRQLDHIFDYRGRKIGKLFARQRAAA